jgi:hypothetical protein
VPTSRRWERMQTSPHVLLRLSCCFLWSAAAERGFARSIPLRKNCYNSEFTTVSKTRLCRQLKFPYSNLYYSWVGSEELPIKYSRVRLTTRWLNFGNRAALASIALASEASTFEKSCADPLQTIKEENYWGERSWPRRSFDLKYYFLFDRSEIQQNYPGKVAKHFKSHHSPSSALDTKIFDSDL